MPKIDITKPENYQFRDPSIGEIKAMFLDDADATSFSLLAVYKKTNGEYGANYCYNCGAYLKSERSRLDIIPRPVEKVDYWAFEKRHASGPYHSIEGAKTAPHHIAAIVAYTFVNDNLVKVGIVE